MRNTVFAILAVTLITSCKNITTDSETLIAEQTEVPMLNTVDLNNTQFDLKTFETSNSDSDLARVPRYALYLYPSTSSDSLKIGMDYGGVIIDEEKAVALGMPADALFYIHSYYAGGGNLYYGIEEDATLNIYKGSQEEPHPEIEAAATTYEKIHSVKIYADSIVNQY